MDDVTENRSSIGLLHFVQSCLGRDTVYVLGTLGNILTRVQIFRLKASYPEFFTDEKVKMLLNRCNGECRAFDCSGLLKRYVMGGFSDYHYMPKFDLNCAALFEISNKKGTIDTVPECPGICLYMPGHTGVYEGNGMVIESTPNLQFGDGVVKTVLSDRQWTYWYEFPWIEYIYESDR